MSSDKLFKRAEKLFPGGVNSPVRFFLPNPVFFSKASGSRIFDVEGKEYLDFCMGFGVNFAGYSNASITEELMYLLGNGVPEGVPSETEVELGETITKAVKSVEMLRFTNSGTEATMHAIRLARAYTNRKLIVKMNAGFHGAHDYALVEAGSGALNFGTPSSPGIPEEVSGTVLIGEFNHEENIEELFRMHGNEIAAVIIEPIMGNLGVIQPKKGFLEFLREITTRYGSLLIFDEVITGFRFHFGAYQDMINIKPDITTMGKIIGGGLPVGLFGGTSEIMKKISPSGNVYQSGTFNANPYTMAAGLATLRFLKEKDYEYTFRLTNWIEDKLTPYKEFGLHVNKAYNMFTVFFNTGEVRDYKSALRSDKEAFMRFFRSCLNHGIYLSPGQFEASFVGMAHTPEEVENAVFKMEYVLEFDMNEDRNKAK